MTGTPRFGVRLRRIGGFAAAIALSGCVGRYESDFPVIVVNRTANSIQALANGREVGTPVSAGQTQEAILKLPESNGNVFANGTAPTPQADVTFTARDTRTGSLSLQKSMTLSKDAPTYVQFDVDDFPSTVPTVARFTFSPTNPTINQDVSFNATSSSVSNGTYAWDFGDGQTGSGVTMIHRYQQRGGTFTVTLSVTSDSRQTSTASRTITVSTTLPPTAANFNFSPAAPAINQDVVFTASGTPVPGGPGLPFPGGPGQPGPGAPAGATYAWDFGDGTTGTGNAVTHRYTRGGTFAVTLRVTSDAGLTAQTSRQLTVSTTLPAGSANFVFSPTDPRTGDSVFFNGSSSTVVNGTYAWDFGDGTRGSGVNPTHSYGQARTYTVSLTVQNQLGQVATTSKTVTVVE